MYLRSLKFIGNKGIVRGQKIASGTNVIWRQFIIPSTMFLLSSLAAIELTNVPLDFACNKTFYILKVCLKDTLILFLYWFENLEHNLATNELCSIVIEGHVRMKPLITIVPHRGA